LIALSVLKNQVTRVYEQVGQGVSEEILDALHLDHAARVADIGAGTGYFSVKIAKRMPEGKMFAVDVEPDMVRYLGERAQREHLSNVTPVQASADQANLPEPVDLVPLVDTYHHIGNRRLNIFH
jgi:precorrin-6B methylase 2